MAMIKCPECGKEISEYSNQCVNCGCPKEQFYSKLNNNFTFAEREDGLFITGYTGKETIVNIPDEYEGKSIVGIGESAFAGAAFDDFSCGKITHIRFPANLQYIEKAAFKNCKYLTDVVLPDSVISIGEESFKCCKLLQNISIDEAGNIKYLNAPQLSSIISTLPYNSLIGMFYDIMDALGIN